MDGWTIIAGLSFTLAFVCGNDASIAADEKKVPRVIGLLALMSGLNALAVHAIGASI